MQMVKELKIMEKEGIINNNNNKTGFNNTDEDSSSTSNATNNTKMMMLMYDNLKGVVGGSAVVVFSSKECCMCHVAKRLLFSLGVAPTVIELDAADNGGSDDIHAVLYHISGHNQPLPAIFVGGKFLGGIDSLMAAHINGSLVPLLKQAGALWL